jgi:tripartite-type tricarboxylate transporter receptor subunit TctC
MSISRSPTTDGLRQVQAGMVRGLAVTSHQRSPYVPILSRAW